LSETPLILYCSCLLAQCTLIATVGIALVACSPLDSFPFALGMGVVVYASAILVFSGLAAFRIRHG
jgi:hypothetical protein